MSVSNSSWLLLTLALWGFASSAPAQTWLGFAPPSSYATGFGPTNMTTGDFNGDDITDIATANFNSDNVSVLLGNGTGGTGDGTFGGAAPYAVGAGPISVTTGDFNGDGVTDLATANPDPNTVAVLLGNGSGGVGDGTFAAPVGYTAGVGPRSVTTGDFNGDGITDLATANFNSSNVSVLLGNGSGGVGDGTFATPVGYTAGSGPQSVKTGDFNGDGITDLVTANFGFNNVSVLVGNGTGGMGDGTFAAPVDYAAGDSPLRVTTGDFNGDGISDLAAVNPNTNGVSVLLGNGSGGVGDGTFAAQVTYAAGTTPVSVATGDFNGDGIADLATGNFDSNNVSVLLGNGSAGVGDGTFAAPLAYAAGPAPRGVTTGDFNGDNIADLSVVNSDGQTVSVLLNLGFQPTEFQIDTDALTWSGDDDATAGTVNGVPFRAVVNGGVAEFYLAGDLLPNPGDPSINVIVRGSQPCRLTILGDMLVPTEFDGSAEGQLPGPGGGRGGNGGAGGEGGGGGPRVINIQPAGGQGIPGANGQNGASGQVKIGEPGFGGNPAAAAAESGADGFGMPASGGIASLPGVGGGGGGGTAGTAGGGGSGGAWIFVAGLPGGPGGNGSDAGDATPGDPGEDQVGAPGMRTPGVEFAGGGGGAGAAGGAGGGGGAGGTAASGSGGAGGGSGITGRGGNGGGAVAAYGGAGGKGGNGASNAHGGGGGGAVWFTVLGNSTDVTMNAAGGNGTSASGTGGEDGQGGDPARGPNGPASSPTETGGVGGNSGSVGRGGNGASGGRGGNATGGGGAGGSVILEFGAGDGPLFSSNVQPGTPGGAVGESTLRRVLQDNPYTTPTLAMSTPYIADLLGGADAFGIFEGRTVAELPILTAGLPPGAFAALYRTSTLFGLAEPGYEWLVYANPSSEPVENPALRAGSPSNPVRLARGGSLRPEFGGPGVQDLAALPPGALFVTLVPENPGGPIIAVFAGTQSGFTQTRPVPLEAGEVRFLAPPVEIDTLAELDAIRNNLSWDYILTADIDASPTGDPGYNSGLGWEPIGTYPPIGSGSGPDPADLYRGTLDGNGFTIEGLVINRPEEQVVGFFSFLASPAEIRDLTLSNATVSGRNYAGTLVGAAQEDTALLGCRIEGGSVVATLTVDCLLAGNPGLCLLGAGGLAGGVFDARVQDCHSSADVTVTGFTGGQQDLVPAWAGGLVGVVQVSTIDSCSAGGSVTVDVGTAAAGGLVGGLYGFVSESYATGDVVSTKIAGGLVGTGNSSDGAQSSYATGNVSGGTFAGGVIGGDGAAAFCYSRGTITGPENLGGICAGIDTVASFSFCASPFSQIGTRVAPIATVGIISYWDATVGGLGFSGPVGRTTAQMTFPYDLATTYQSAEWQPSAGHWVFDDASSLNNGYPYLPWQTARVTASYTAGTGGQLRVDGGANVPTATLVRIPGANSASIEAVSTSGLPFVRWSDGSTENPRLDRNLRGDFEVTAIFDVPTTVAEVIEYILGLSASGFPDRNGDGIVDAADVMP